MKTKSKRVKPGCQQEPCCALWMWDGSGLNIAIPKKRGSGYLKQPYGHHLVHALNDIADDEKIDMCGLDGYLNLEYRCVPPGDRAAIIDRVMPRLAAHYGFAKWREDESAFWEAVESFLHNRKHPHPESGENP